MLVRTDLPGTQVSVQAAHAAIEAARHLPAGDEHPHLVICGVPNEATLVREQDRLESFGLRCFPFYEADRGDELTAFSIGPLTEPSARRRLSRYHLLKGE